MVGLAVSSSFFLSTCVALLRHDLDKRFGLPGVWKILEIEGSLVADLFDPKISSFYLALFKKSKDMRYKPLFFKRIPFSQINKLISQGIPIFDSLS